MVSIGCCSLTECGVSVQPAPGEDPAAAGKKNRQIRVYRPSTGEHANQADYILSRYTRVKDAVARSMWRSIFAATAEACMHGANCKIPPSSSRPPGTIPGGPRDILHAHLRFESFLGAPANLLVGARIARAGKIGAKCEAGKRVRTVHLLAGSTLPLWGTVRRGASAARHR